MLGTVLLCVLVVSGACGAAGPVQPAAIAPVTVPTWEVAADESVPSTPPEVAVPVTALPGDEPARGPSAARAARGGPAVTGRMEIPKIGLDHITYEGATLAQIDYGPSHWPGTPMPGQVGNTVFPGHRTTKTRPFFDIDQLVAGDRIIMTTGDGRFVYEVYQSLIVRPSEMWIVDNTPEAIITIFACHPRGSARYRYVVRARLLSQPLPSVPPARARPAQPKAPASPPPTSQPAPPPSTTPTTRPNCIICLP